MRNIRNDNHEMDAMPGVIKEVGATITAVLLSVIAVIIQAIFSIPYNIGVDDNCLFDPHYSNCSDCFHINQYYSNYNYDSGFNRRGRKNCADCIAGRKIIQSGAKYWNYVVGRIL